MTERTLTVYAYNIQFGDCILIEVPQGQGFGYILIDCGNKGKGATDAPILAALKDIHEKTKGHIDLYILTHEHMDHCKGLLVGDKNKITFTFGSVWLTASAEGQAYYNKHPNAEREKKRLTDALEALIAARGAGHLPLAVRDLLELNASTDASVAHIRQLVKKPQYVYRGKRASHPLKGVQLRILAPEEDTSVYYAKARKALAAVVPSVPGNGARPAAQALPLPGIDAKAFYELIERLDEGLGETAFLIDQAANNTSVVIELTWRNKRLLFTGDAELGSWAMMKANHDAGKAQDKLRPVDLLKVGHHGSKNATPKDEILDLVLPPARNKQAQAIVSTRLNAYPGVPDKKTLDRVEARTKELVDTRRAKAGEAVAARIEGS